MQGMRVVKGKVVGNTVVLDQPLPEGAEVGVVATESPETWGLSDGDWAALQDAREAVARGELVTDEALHAELDAIDRE